MICNPLTLTVLTDTHYYCKENGTTGKAYDIANSKSQKLLADSAEVLEKAFEQIASDTECDIVLISGDLTNNGELNAHAEFIEMLRGLKNKGKKVYVITATHDFRKMKLLIYIKAMKNFIQRLLRVRFYMICTVNSALMKQFRFIGKACHILFSFATVTDFLL